MITNHSLAKKKKKPKLPIKHVKIAELFSCTYLGLASILVYLSFFFVKLHKMDMSV